MSKNVISDPGFGTGISVTNTYTGDSVRATSQGVVRITPSSVIYQDGAGRFATLGNLTPCEVQVLKEKHFGK